MNELSAFERRLAAGLEAYAGPRRSIDAIAIARTAASRASVGSSILSRFSAVMGQGTRVQDRRLGDRGKGRSARPLLVFAVIALVAALAFGALTIGSGLVRLPSQVPPIPSPQSTSPSASPEASGLKGPLGGGLIVVHDFQNPHDGPFGVFLVDAASGERTQLGRLPGLLGRAYTFQWSADRTHILIPDALGSTPALQAPTEVAKRYTFICCKDLHGAERWVLSPLGDRIAAVRQNETGDRALEIVVLDVDGDGSLRLPLPSGVGAVGNGVSWAPDGTAVVIEGCRPCNNAAFGQRPSPVAHQHLFIVPLDGSPVRELLDDTDGGAGTPAWSPDGSSIAVVRITCQPPSAMPYCEEGPGVLETVQVATGTTSRIGEVGPISSAPLWSGDGRRIVYADDTGLFVIGADGTGLVRLVDGEVGLAQGRFQWSPDGLWLLYRSGDSLWVVPSDGGEPRLVGPYPGAGW